ncbi:6-phosphofructokinase [Pasteurellaceae bacterium 22721_9_1]
MLKKCTALFSILLLSGCAIKSSKPEVISEMVKLNVPKVIKYHESSYQLRNQKDLGSMARYVYFEKKENNQNWKSAVELLHDRNAEKMALSDRIQLREKVYRTNGVEHFNLNLEGDDLYAFVIYSPNPNQANWQVEVARGADVKGCGFVQFQYSVKVPQSHKLMQMGKVKLIGYLKKYAIDKELARLHELKWDWQCAMPEG